MTLTQALAELVITTPFRTPGAIRPLFTLEIGAPFPVRCLRPVAPGWKPDVIIPVQLMSMRHVEADSYTVFCWFRNMDRPPSHEGQEQWYFERSLDEFAKLRRQFPGKRVLLELYPSGLEPANLGFFRALVEVQRKDLFAPPRLVMAIARRTRRAVELARSRLRRVAVAPAHSPARRKLARTLERLLARSGRCVPALVARCTPAFDPWVRVQPVFVDAKTHKQEPGRLWPRDRRMNV